MKNGFTLIELLAVIVILVVISLIAVPRIMDAIDNTRIEALRQNNDSLVKAAQNYLVTNNSSIPNNLGEKVSIPISSLVEEKFVDSINSPFSSSDCEGYVYAINVGDNQLDFVPSLSCDNSFESDNLVGYWRLSNDAYDYSFNKNHGTVINTENALGFDNKVNNAMRFDGSSSYVIIDGQSIYNTHNGAFTYSLWVKSDNYNPTQSVLSRRTGCNNNSHFNIFLSNNRINLGYRSTSELTSASVRTSDYVLTNGSWHHIVVSRTWGEASTKIYVDGQLVLLHSDNSINGANSNSNPIIIGAQWSSDVCYTPPVTDDEVRHHFNGTIQEVKIFNKILNEDEIRYLYNRAR